MGWRDRDYIKGHSPLIGESLKGHTRPAEQLTGALIKVEDSAPSEVVSEPSDEYSAPAEVVSEPSSEGVVKRKNPWKKLDGGIIRYESGISPFKVIKNVFVIGLMAWTGWLVWSTMKPALTVAGGQSNSTNGLNTTLIEGMASPILLIIALGGGVLILLNVFGIFRNVEY